MFSYRQSYLHNHDSGQKKRVWRESHIGVAERVLWCGKSMVLQWRRIERRL